MPDTHDTVTSTVTIERDDAVAMPLPPSMVAVTQLTEHPGNVRTDLNLSAEFCASIAEAGVRVPLLITSVPEGGYRVIEGHRRLAAAVKAGISELPCVLDPSRADDEAGQYLDMLIANSGSHRRNLKPVEEAAALFAAHEAGATRTRIRKATGRKAEEVKTALRAGKVVPAIRARSAEFADQLTLDQFALLADFDGDEDAIEQILQAFTHGFSTEYVAERIRQERAEAAEHERLRAELEAAGTAVTTDLPAQAVRLADLDHDGEPLTAETHASCPGRGAYFPPWSRTQVVHYCADPSGHGHASRYQSLTSAAGNSALAEPGPGERSGPDPERRLVIEGNKAWTAAAEVRKRWLTQLFARRAAPKEAARFVTGQLLTMPEPLRISLASAHSKPLFTQIAGQPSHVLADGIETCPAGRLPLLMLAPIVAAYECEMFGTDPNRRATWREDRYSPCPRRDAGKYLAFLASLGYQLAPIEQAVADGVRYTGDNPAEPLTGSSAGEQTDTEPATGEHDSPDAPSTDDESTTGDIHDVSVPG